MATTPTPPDATKTQESDMPEVQNLSVSQEQDTGSSVNSAPESSGQSTPLTEPVQTNVPKDDQVGAGSKETHESTAVAGTTTTAIATRAADQPIRTPFEHPLPSCRPPARPELNADQTAKYASLLSTVRGWTELPTSSSRNAPAEPLGDAERMFLTRECLLRYLRATSWSPAHAAQRLQATLTWRREFGADGLTASDVSEENETGKQVILGYDVEARPCLYLDPGRQNTKKSERQIQHLVFMLDRAIDLMHAGQETTALLINFKTSTAGGNPSVGQGRQVLGILQGHYPERLGKALISDLPWYVTTFFKLISPFIDPVTKSKMIFNQPLRETYVPASQLWQNHGGNADFEYEHAVYWPALDELCKQRRAEYAQRWVRAGKKIGEFEAYLRGGEQKPLSEVEEA